MRLFVAITSENFLWYDIFKNTDDTKHVSQVLRNTVSHALLAHHKCLSRANVHIVVL